MSFRRVCLLLATASGLGLALSCGGDAGTPPPVPVLLSINPTTAQVTAGDTLQFSATVTGSQNTGVTWSVVEATGGSINPAGLYTAPETPGSFHVVATSQISNTLTATALVGVQAKPVITLFSASPATVNAGESSLLQIAYTGGYGIIDNGVGAVTSGDNARVVPAATTTYTLSVTNLIGSKATRTATVTVLTQPAITSFTATANPMTLGSGTQLRPVFSGGTGAVDQGVGAVASGAAIPVNPAATTTYTLTVANALGASVTLPLTLTVVPAPAITSFAAVSPTISVGGSTRLLGIFANGTGSVDKGVGAVASGTPSAVVSPAATTTYTLTVTNAAGAQATRTATVTVTNGPAITSFTANHTQVDFGQTATLQWTFTGNPTSLTLDGVDVLSGPASKVVNPRRRQTYTLVATNAQGTNTAQLTITARGLDVFAGNIGGPGSLDGTGTSAQLNQPFSGVSDPAGNVYFCDTENHSIRKVTPAGVVTTFAGTSGTAGYSDGVSVFTLFRRPKGICRDAAGNFYVSDTGNYVIRKIAADGQVSTIAGSAQTNGFHDGQGADAVFDLPQGIAVDASGNLFVADYNNHAIRRIDPAGNVTTFAGHGGLAGQTDATGTAAFLFWPVGLAMDGNSNLYVTEFGNSTIRKITSGAVVTTLAGSALNPGSQDGTGTAARFNQPAGLCFDPAGNLMVADMGNHTIRRVTSAGVVTTPVGQAGVSGYVDASANLATFTAPGGLVARPGGTQLVLDTGNDLLRVISVDAAVTTLAGTPVRAGSTDGDLSQALFSMPQGLAVGADGSVYVADTGNHTIRKISPEGQVTTLAGQAGVPGGTDGETGGTFNGPQALAVDGEGNVYVADTGNHAIRVVSSLGAVRTLAGKAGTPGSATGPGADARFDTPTGIALDAAGAVYVADSKNHVIRKVLSNGTTTTFIGVPNVQGNNDNAFGPPRFSLPQAVAFSPAGLLIADTGNGTIRSVTADGQSSTLAGLPGLFGTTDGQSFNARFNGSSGLAVDAAGAAYVTDKPSQSIRKVAADGTTTTPVGNLGREGILLGLLPGGLFRPHGIAVTALGDVLVVSGNGILQVTAP
ncbi:MAG: SMP-30/gluconolactonase/LRE family protein [Holophagaceae bacterium]|nr:SMP-30/gluconolactonase/LRE family protein [Holophagaceae bacterium]